MIDLRPYVTEQGRTPFRDWFFTLDPVSQTRVDFALERLQLGSEAAKGVGAGVLELRLDFGPGYRVYFARDGERLVILLGGGTKKRQQRDIAAAKQLWQDYKRRKRES